MSLYPALVDDYDAITSDSGAASLYGIPDSGTEATWSSVRTKIKEAREVLHKLSLGDTIIAVSYDGRHTQFKPTDYERLSNYINVLLRVAPDGYVSAADYQRRRRRGRARVILY